MCHLNYSESNFSKAEAAKEPRQKLLKVCILGRTNVGKSTLINQILQLNVCDVSKKIHTTLFPVNVAFTHKNTQIVFIDTPGLISKEEAARLIVKKEPSNWYSVLQHADVIAVMEEAKFFRYFMAFDAEILKYLKDLSDKTLILIINKIDLIKDKSVLLQITDWVVSLEKDRSSKLKFDKIFYVSALKNDGVKDITSYLIKEAKEDQWLLNEGLVCDTPLDEIIIKLVRAEILNLLPYHIPFTFEYEIAFLEESHLGNIICQLLVKSRKGNNKMIFKLTTELKSIAKKVESDIYTMFRKSLKLRIDLVKGEYRECMK